jgi:filamentous hemagglutinin family protein
MTDITATTGAGSLETVVVPPPPLGNIYNINNGTVREGPTGNNLFHSFGDFNLAANDIASFNNTTGVANITNVLSRVTGNDPSNIFGTMRSTIDGANFFFINPNGIVFGPQARLDMSGSVYFSTANSIRLTDTITFDMTATSVTLTAAPVAAFGFLGPSVASIAVQESILEVPEGKTLAMIGGGGQFTSGTGEIVPSGVTVTGGTLSAPSGQVHLVSVASVGEVTLPANTDMAFGVGNFPKLGSVELSNGSVVSTSTLTDVDGNPLSTNSSGTVSIRGGQFVMNNASIESNNFSALDGATVAIDIAVRADTEITPTSHLGDVTITENSSLSSLGCNAAGACGTGSIGDIQITGRDVTISNDAKITTLSLTEAAGSVGGNVHILARNFSLQSGATIVTDTFGFGDGGNIDIATTNSFSISGLSPTLGISSQIGTSTNGTLGKSGAVTIQGPIAQMADTAGIRTQAGERRSGDISFHVDEIRLVRGGTITSEGGQISIDGYSSNMAQEVTLSGQTASGSVSRIDVFGSGNSTEDSGTGDIRIHTQRFSMTDGSRINSDANGVSGGPILIEASQSATIAGDAKIRVAGGNGGNVTITTPSLTIEQATIQTQTDQALSDSGPITINANTVVITSGGLLDSSTTANQGGGGDIIIQGFLGTKTNATSLKIDGIKSGLFTDTQGARPSGNIFVSANTVTLQNGGMLSSKTSGTETTATGGSITIDATNQVTMTGGASITASSTGLGNAGNILINAGNRFEARNSSVTTKSDQVGGGNIEINARDRFRLVNSQVNASAFLDGGNITIDPRLVLLQNSQILAQSILGNGGNITITTPLFLSDHLSLVSASSQFGLNGTVTIQRPTSNLSGSLGTLTSKPGQAQSLVTQRCAALANGQASSFVVAGREQLPAVPGSWLTSPLALAGLGENLDAGDGVASGPAPIATHDTDTVSLRRLTPARFLIANFADSEATGCHS